MHMTEKSVLLIEDDKLIREMCVEALTAAGLHVHVAENGKEGVELALLHHPAVILMDIMMPIMDGHEAAKRIRADAWGKSAHIIYLTNFGDPEHVFKAITSGTDEYLIKAHTGIDEIVNKVRIAMHATS
jgi:DNA-binding response OmpR family regulator